MQAPIMPNGSKVLISAQFTFLRLVPPRTSEAVKSRARTSGTANCSGCDSASSGTEMSAEPKPVMPRMKYALIRMHSTSTMSAKAASFIYDGASLPSAQRRGWTLTVFCSEERLCLLKGLQRACNQPASGLELASGCDIVPGLGRALDVGEEIAERVSAQLAARALERMRGPHRTGNISPRHAV